MKINCTFENQLDDSICKKYICKIVEANITEKDHVIKKFKGIHKTWKSHRDVKCVCFSQTNVNYFPRGLQKHFPRLTHLIINGGGIEEISKDDLKGLNGLVLLAIVDCQLTSLPDDLLTEMPSLREVSFAGNKIEFASSNLLKPLLGRQNVKVDLERNKIIDACFWPKVRNSLKSLEELMELLNLKSTLQCFIPDPLDAALLLKEMWLSGKFSDLTIIAEEKEFKIHKNILGMRSEVFAQIFEDEIEATEIKIPDFSAKSVDALLHFIYTNEISEDGNAKENFEIADKFKVAAMKRIYEKNVCDQIDEAHALEIFMFAHRFTSQILKEKAFHLIVKKFPETPVNLLEDPEKLKKFIDYRRGYEEILEESKKL